tara:strand:- start:906 stop:2192 length:1287 start_codon:yes stop_codon:yes gene_type:complete
MNNPLNITQLGELIGRSIPKNKLLVKGEVSQPKIFRGNLYLSLKDSGCNIKSIVWKNKLDFFENKITEGDKITVEGTLDFYIGGGSVSFIINKLIKHEGEGELFALYQEIKQKFLDKGYFLDKHKAPEPTLIKNILLITSENGAAIQDFIFNIDNNKSKLEYEIIDVPVQGNDCPKNIIDILDNNNEEFFKKYDLIVITRGGGSFEDLFGFSKPELIESVFNFKKPILSAIGHMVDTSLLDLVSDFSSPTPSLASQFIIDINKRYIKNLEYRKNNIKEILIQSMNLHTRKINRICEKINSYIYSFDQIKNDIFEKILNLLNKRLIEISKFESKIDLKINTLEIEMKTNNINFVLLSENSNFSSVIKDSSEFESRIFKSENKKEFFISVLNKENTTNLEIQDESKEIVQQSNERKIYKIINFEIEEINF